MKVKTTKSPVINPSINPKHRDLLRVRAYLYFSETSEYLKNNLLGEGETEIRINLKNVKTYYLYSKKINARNQMIYTVFIDDMALHFQSETTVTRLFEILDNYFD
jgi:hypothetical protein